MALLKTPACASTAPLPCYTQSQAVISPKRWGLGRAAQVLKCNYPFALFKYLDTNMHMLTHIALMHTCKYTLTIMQQLMCLSEVPAWTRVITSLLHPTQKQSALSCSCPSFIFVWILWGSVFTTEREHAKYH